MRQRVANGARGCGPWHNLFVLRPLPAQLLIGLRPSRVVDQLCVRVDALTFRDS